MTVPLPPFQALLDAHGRAVHSFLQASVGPIEADDCYQETWLAALRAYPDLKDASNLRGWVFTIAHRKVIDHARARSRRPLPVPDIEPLAESSREAPARDDGLWRQVARLPPKQRAAIALRFVADADYSVIAAALQISPEAARRNVHEGLKRLREEPKP